VESLGIENASLAEVIVFAILAGATIAGALLTITRRNPVAAVMSLVGTFFALAGLYATLSAHFVAVLQVAVYAGAIMVLFIFVVMILNRDEVEPVSFRGIITRALGVIASGFGILVAVRIVHLTREMPVLAGPTGALAENYGTVAATGESLFRQFVFPFEAISLLLLVAIVGGILVSRSQRQEDESLAVAERHRAIKQVARDAQEIRALASHDAHGAGDAHGSAHGASHH
jgi:NADH-quinone oxidoreductase subunit J